jgi:hypothetical protein
VLDSFDTPDDETLTIATRPQIYADADAIFAGVFLACVIAVIVIAVRNDIIYLRRRRENIHQFGFELRSQLASARPAPECARDPARPD